MKANYSNLAEFLGAYFHQDWTSDAEFSEQITKLYLSEWPRDEARLALQELEVFLMSLNEGEMDREVEVMGCYFAPASEGYASASEWLHAVMNLMRKTLA
jgi:hypothetical protein